MTEAITIFDRLSISIKSMKKLHALEVQKANKVQQDIINNNYHRIVEKAEILCKAVCCARKQFNFQIECLSDLINLLSFLQSAGSRSFVEQEQVNKATNIYNGLHDKIKKEWSKHYQTLSSSTVNTLKAIRGLDDTRISSCINKIEAASMWDASVDTLMTLKDAIVQANQLIQSLNLDQEVITFLGKITSGKATLADLNENVLQWMKEEQLLSKIKLSFIKF